MANALYGKGRDKFLNADIDFSADTIVVYLVDVADYSVDIDVDEFLSSVAVGGRVANATLASKTTALGVADAADTVLSSVTGDVCEALVLVKSTGDAATSPLFGYIDVATGFPVTPNGGDITITWDSGGNKIFKL